MKVLLLRGAVLGAVVVLGCIAIANAQRGADSSDISINGSTDEANPLRSDASASPATPYPSSAQPATRSSQTRTGASQAMADPFGLQVRRSGTAPAAAAAADDTSIPDGPLAQVIPPQNAAATSSRYSRTAAPASAEPSQSGPALIKNQFAAAPSTPATDNQEPARFKADPFAEPASPTRTVSTDRDDFAPRTAAARPADSMVEGEGVGQPGAKQLEGVQTPQLSIQKTAPKEIQVGKAASFRTMVRNVGQTAANEVEIRDQVPKGTRLLGTAPQATRNERGEIVWSLGTLRPGEERSVEMQLMPMAEGEVGSVASVHFGANATVRTVATRPQLAVNTSGPQKVLIGEQATLTITVSNPGSGVATGVVLEERIPPGLQHPAGAELEYEVGDLKPGESRKLDLTLTANRPGRTTNVLSVRGNGNLRADHKLDLEVLAPQLDVAVDGPKRRYLERQATYQFSVTNPGTASAKQVELVANLPAGLKFVSANNAGYYEESSRTVRWRLEELPANVTGSVELVTMPVEAGQQAIRLRGTAQTGLTVEKEQPVMIEGIAATLFQVADAADPIEVGGETTYEVRVANQGSKAAANVRLAAILPSELKAIDAEGPTHHTIQGDRVVFDPIPSLAPKAETTYRVRVQSLKQGDLRTRFQLLTDDMQTPVVKEESTRVYADE